MNLEDSILRTVRDAIGIGADSSEFDTELVMHINAALGTLNQNGVGLPVFVEDESLTWAQFKDDTQVEGNVYYHMVPLFVKLSTKLIFDPPPPSAVEMYKSQVDQMLWRLKVAYEGSLMEADTNA